MRHPLDGVTVVSLEQAVAAPFATRQLTDPQPSRMRPSAGPRPVDPGGVLP
jgi:hypothetical protein